MIVRMASVRVAPERIDRELRHSPGPMRQVFFCTEQASWLGIHKNLITPLGCIMALL